MVNGANQRRNILARKSLFLGVMICHHSRNIAANTVRANIYDNVLWCDGLNCSLAHLSLTDKERGLDLLDFYGEPHYGACFCLCMLVLCTCMLLSLLTNSCSALLHTHIYLLFCLLQRMALCRMRRICTSPSHTLSSKLWALNCELYVVGNTSVCCVYTSMHSIAGHEHQCIQHSCVTCLAYCYNVI